jgi:hypothetical protein
MSFEEKLGALSIGANQRNAMRLAEYCRNIAEITGGEHVPLPGNDPMAPALASMCEEIDRLGIMTTSGLGFQDTPAGRGLELGIPELLAEGWDRKFDVVSLGGWSASVPGAHDAPHDPGRAVEIVETFYGEDFPRVAIGLTRAEVEGGRFCWGRGDTETHFSIAVTFHGNTRQGWIRLPVPDPRWWHDDECVPREQIYARSIGENRVGGPVCLGLTFGVFEG